MISRDVSIRRINPFPISAGSFLSPFSVFRRRTRSSRFLDKARDNFLHVREKAKLYVPLARFPFFVSASQDFRVFLFYPDPDGF
jgi:hypothetical protein